MITPEPAPLDTCDPYQKLSLEIFSVVIATTLCVILEEILDASFDVPVALVVVVFVTTVVPWLFINKTQQRLHQNLMRQL